jgi:hypothetical protein
LFKLNENDFGILYLCLAKRNLEAGLPKQLELESIGYEEKITRDLYNDYKNFRNDLFENIVK